MKPATKRKLPPFWLLILGFAIIYGCISVALTAAFKLPWHLRMPVGPAVAAGVVLLALGAALEIWSFRSLTPRRAFGKELYLPKSESTLVTTGAYAYVRNPLYVAATLLFLGWFFALRLTPLAFLTVLFFVHFILVAKWEESELRRRFGEEYDEYRRRVPMLVPRIRRKSLSG